MIRYGVFKLGQIWTVTDDRGASLGYMSREAALAALATMLETHRAVRREVVVTLQDERGGLWTIANPLDERADPANDDGWDRLLELKTRSSPHDQPPTANSDEA
jgi:hypothetical protein